MENTEKDLREALRDLASQLMEVEENSSLEDLKIRCGEIFEALVILHHQQNTNEVKDDTVGMVENSTPIDTIEETSTEQVYTEQAFTEDPSLEESKAGDSSGLQGSTEEGQEIIEDEAANDQIEKEAYPTLSDLFVPTFGEIKEDMSQKEEFKDTVSLEETENLFTTPREEARQLSLNDKLVGNSIHFGLNDRIAFVNKLFNFSQSDFTKVVDRLNGMKSFDEANHYIQYQVKKNYNWKGKEDLEERFMEAVERRFMS